MKKITLGLLLLGALSTPAFAQQNPDAFKVKVQLGAAITSGGEEFISFDLFNQKKDTFKAGDGLTLNAGLSTHLSSELSVLTTVGYQVTDNTLKNGYLKLVRIPVEVLGFYHINDSWKIGAGLRVVSGVRVTADANAKLPDIAYNVGFGKVIEGEYLITPNVGIKARYVKEEFSVKNGVGKVNSDHVGVGVAVYF